MDDNQKSYYQNKKSISQNYWKLSTKTELETHFELFFSQRFNFPSALVPILIDNKVSKDNFELFLEPKIKNFLPDPNIFMDMDKTVKRIANEIENKNPIGIFGDYDVDGATSAALLKLFLQYFGTEVHIHIPDRFLEGYGPNISALNSLVSKGSNLIITVDCGINSYEPLKELNKTNIDCIIIDHHTPGDNLPPAFSIVNPKRKENGIEYHYLSAVGVTFIMIVGLTRELRQRGVFEKIKEPNLFKFLDLVALGTVCDVVPLKGLNRCFVKAGLNIISQRKNLGINALCDISDLNKIPDEETLGYKLGPKINAAGRIGSSDMGVSLLISRDINRANELASKLYQLNEKRKKLTNNSILEARVNVVSSESGASLLSTSIQDTNISLPEDCNSSCKKILAGRASREIADMLAMRVSKLVKSFSSNSNALNSSVNAVNFELVNFTKSNKQEFLEILENDFPGFIKIENMQTKGSLSRFIYYTEIPNYKLEKWVSIGLEEIGIEQESGFEASIRPGNIEIFLIPKNKPRGSTGNPIKYH